MRGPAFEDTEPLRPVPVPVAASPAAHATRAQGARPAGRRAPVVWSGHANPEDTGATKLLQAVRTAGIMAEADAASTQTLPRIKEPVSPGRGAGEGGGRAGPGPVPPTGRASVVGPPRSPQPSEAEPLLRGVRPARGAFDAPDTGELEAVGYAGPPGYGDDDHGAARTSASGPGSDARRRESVRHAYYPGRRMNLGVVLLPLRVFLGFITVYAGMGKLCDPVYFDGGERGSMVTWLRSLDPWAVASPLRDFALAHPVGSGLTVAFLQVIVGVLTMFGLWQRVAASLGTLLSAALLMTVSWSTVPAYDAPDIIYLAAWSPLIIAGAPVYSIDGRLAGDAWRRLGPRVEIWDLRRRVLRRGAVIATVVVGLALLVGSLLGSAVRSSQTATVREREEVPANRLPGSPMPRVPGESASSGQATRGPGNAPGERGEAGNRRKERHPKASETRPGEQRATSGPETTPSAGQTQGQSQPGGSTPAQQQSAPTPQPRTPQQPRATAGGSSGPQSGTARSSSSATGGGSSSGGSSSGGGGGGGGGALGGLLGR